MDFLPLSGIVVIDLTRHRAGPVTSRLLGDWGAEIIKIEEPIDYIAAPQTKNKIVPLINKSAKWMPDWNNPLLWKLGLMMGCVNATYFATNFFIPRYLHETNFEDLTSSSLIALNLGQIPASIILMMAGTTVAKARYPYLLSGIGLVASLSGIMYFGTEYIVVLSAFIGFFSSIVLILILGLPSMISEPHEVHRTTSLMLTVGYTIHPVIVGVQVLG
ncbi:CoA transferase [Xenorhabdus bovienii]|uniref:CoA transferase n=1 Tax=Xenorhabdus bovienii TaxID=40576 RepID=UPI001EDE8AA4|nr:CoA transferase [Xenorhabdus bovienii]MCG3461970.1 CoA transferase [Xenorhabdus bovienii]